MLTPELLEFISSGTTITLPVPKIIGQTPHSAAVELLSLFSSFLFPVLELRSFWSAPADQKNRSSENKNGLS